jgi:hypothetical protein
VRAARTVRLEVDSAGQFRETDEAVIVPYILVREHVSEFCNGRGYKPAAELRSAAFTLRGAWVVAFKHADSVFVSDRRLLPGQVDPASVRFDDAVNAVKGGIHFLKTLSDEAFLASIRDGTLSKDSSATYYCDERPEVGKFGDDTYDFIQSNFVFGHVAVGVPEGRCPSPFCGINADEPSNFLRVRVRDPGLFVSCRLTTVVKDARAGIFALVGKLRDKLSGQGFATGEAKTRDLLFDLGKGWSQEKAEAWAKAHQDEIDDLQSTSGGELNDVRGKRLGLLDPLEVLARSRRLVSNMSPYGDRTSVMTSAGWGARHHDGAL